MSRAKETLKIVCLALLAACMGTVALHVRGWCRGIDHLQEQAQDTAGSVKEAADTSNKASTEMLDTIGTLNYVTLPKVNGLVDSLSGTTFRAKTLLAQVGQTAEAATGTTQALGRAADATTLRIGALADQQARADVVLEQLATIPPAVTAALEPMAGLELSLTRTSDATGDFIGGAALTGAVQGVGTLTGNLAVATDHVDQRWLAPYSGLHPRRHAIWQFTQGAIGLGTRGAEGAYYFSNIH